jgi:PBP1b-binding outer membrane lipoprotein LpoB
MKKLRLITALAVFLAGCAGQTPAQSRETAKLAGKGLRLISNVATSFLPLPRGFAK